MDADNIGDIGEKTFGLWCSQAGMTAVCTTRDRNGWDFLVTFPAPGGPDDAPERAVKVQVKTTTKKSAGASISLKNWRRMATERTPWFSLHLVLDGTNVKDAFLVHIDERRVADALKRIREVDQGLRAERRMSMTPIKADRLDQKWPDSLQKRFLRHVGSSEDSYAAAKAAWAKESGYVGARHGLTVDVASGEGEDPLAVLADWIVGLTAELPIRALRVVERRFEIDKLVKDLRDVEGRLKIDRIPPVTTATITIASPDNSERVVVETEVRIARRYIKWLAPKYERIHFAGKGLSFISEPVSSTGNSDPPKSAFRAQFSLPGEGVETRLGDLVRIGTALRLLATGDGPPAQVRFQARGVLDVTTPARTDLALDVKAGRFILVVERAASVARHFGIGDDIILDPGDLMDDLVHVVMLAAGLDRSVSDLESMTIQYDGDAVHGKEVTVLYAPAFKLASDLAGALVGLVGRAECSPEGNMRLMAPTIRCFSKFIGREEDWEAGVRTRLGDAVNQLLSEGFTNETIFRPRVDDDEDGTEPPAPGPAEAAP